jgi:hypothetical protein
MLFESSLLGLGIEDTRAIELVKELLQGIEKSQIP